MPATSLVSSTPFHASFGKSDECSIISDRPAGHRWSTGITIEDRGGQTTISVIYCPPRHRITDDNFDTFFSTLGTRFIARGDLNAKHTQWGSKLTTTRGTELYKIIQKRHLNHLSTGEPTYWATDRNKRPDLINLFISKYISQNYLKIESCLEMTSDHTPVIVTISFHITTKTKAPSLHNFKTNWDKFRALVDGTVSLHIPLKTTEDMDNAIEYFNSFAQDSSWASTPEARPTEKTNHHIPANIRELLAEKRRLRRTWHNTRHPHDKSKFNKAAKKLKKPLHELINDNLQARLKALTESTEYSHQRSQRSTHYGR